MPTVRTRRTLLVTTLVAVVVLAVGLVALNVRLFVYPASSTPAHADAVVVLAGGSGERLDKGLELVRKGVAPNLVLSNGSGSLCDGNQSLTVYCFRPEPDDTRGEAEAVSRLAAEHGWNHLVLVTSDYHATRAHLLLDRCFSGRVDVTTAHSSRSPLPLLSAVVHEWGGLIESAIHRAC